MTTANPATPAGTPDPNSASGAPAPTPAPTTGRPAALALLIPAAVGCAVSLGLGVYGHVHSPTGIAVNLAGFSSALTAKTWLTTVATVLALVQLVTALAIYGRLGFAAPPWFAPVHRWSGRLAFLAAVPVAMQCLYALGYQTYSTRVMVHSLLGCLFFGVFTAKMLVLPRHDAPGWALPLLGGTVFAVLVAIWFTSAYWYFSTFGIQR